VKAAFSYSGGFKKICSSGLIEQQRYYRQPSSCGCGKGCDVYPAILSLAYRREIVYIASEMRRKLGVCLFTEILDKRLS
jgi:hypothetical protein